jgi:Mg2+ and Co2+ transporter CorA
MNVPIPFAEHGWAFWMVLGLAFFASAAFLTWGRYKKW